MALVLVFALVLYWLLDIAIGAFLPPQYFDTEFRRQALAYADEPYFSDDFLAESLRQPEGWYTPADSNLVLPAEFAGRFFHVDRLQPTDLTYRRTLNLYDWFTPDAVKVLFIGGSTVYSSEVPDADTLPSRLAAELNGQGRKRYSVRNAGVTSANSLQEYERLKAELERGLRPNLVLVYNGVNDVYQGVYQGRPGQVMFTGTREGSLVDQIKELLPKNLYRWIRARAEANGIRSIPDHMTSDRAVAELAGQTAGIYAENIRRIQDLAVRYGFRMVVILQPQFYALEGTGGDADVRQVRERLRITQPGLPKAFDAAYAALYTMIRRLAEDNGIDVHDLSRLFREKKGPIFLDFCHVNSRGNRLIAHALARIVLADG